MDKNHIIAEIRRTAEANGGKPLGTSRFFQETGIGKVDWWGKHWARWNDALKEAGYGPNTLQGSYPDEYVLQRLIETIRELNRFPTMSELRLKASNTPNFPAHNTFRRLGKKGELVSKLIVYCKSTQGHEDVLKLCETVDVATINMKAEKTLEPEFGFVYLLKSGKHFKIGRTLALGRREYELAIQLPEKVKTIHAIKTDDPVGIEAYWHRRFEERRVNGEWFELSSSDVNAFKRRKFM